jgi:FMN-dependent NADH-azoreductase
MRSASPQPRLILSVIGIADVTFIAAGGPKAVDLGEISREDFLTKFQDEIAGEAA